MLEFFIPFRLTTPPDGDLRTMNAPNKDDPRPTHAPAASALLRTSAALTAAALLLLLPLPARAQEEQALDVSCREVRSFDAIQYWFWDGYSGLTDMHDFAHERWGRIGLDPALQLRGGPMAWAPLGRERRRVDVVHALGEGRPLAAYLDDLARQIAAHNREPSSSGHSGDEL